MTSKDFAAKFKADASGSLQDCSCAKFHLAKCLQDPDLRQQRDEFCTPSLDGTEQKIGRGRRDCSCALGTIETENCFQDFFTFPQRVISLCNSLPQEILPESVTQRQKAKLDSNLRSRGTAEQGLFLTLLF